MRIAIVTAMWQRPQIFDLFAQSIEKLKSIKDIEIFVFVAGSEGLKSKFHAKRHGFKYIEVKNTYVSDKFNKATQLAKSCNPDYILITGSDDLMSVKLLKFYLKLAKQKTDFIGVQDFYYYDTVSKNSMYWMGYSGQRRGEPAGALRMISKRLMNELQWKPFDDKKVKGIDSTLWRKVNQIDHSRCIFSLSEYCLFACDVKSEINITKFRIWENCVSFPSEIILKQFNYLPK